MEKNEYGSLIMRIKALIIDALVYTGLMIVATKILESFNNVHDLIRGLVFVFIFVLYDPLCTSILGGTVGHLIIGLRVRNHKNEDIKIVFPFALLRFIIKAALGWISLLTVSGNEKKKAIHDSLAGSVVIIAK